LLELEKINKIKRIVNPLYFCTDFTADMSEPLKAALERAYARGRVTVSHILAGKEMLTAEQFAHRLRINRETLNTLVQNHEVLYLGGPLRSTRRFPDWQIGKDGKLFADKALPGLFQRLGGGIAQGNFV
jgi:hypothetical protein